MLDAVGGTRLDLALARQRHTHALIQKTLSEPTHAEGPAGKAPPAGNLSPGRNTAGYGHA
ncbi:hypothetical protein [Dactylosporangium matsuzakiense]|nr:hypothetical protein [Dactylosporangium matsuzakiense]